MPKNKMPKKAHLGASQILKFLCLCSSTHSVGAHLTIFMRFKRTDLVSIHIEFFLAPSVVIWPGKD